MTVRCESRSVTAPPSSMNRARGTLPSASTVPSAMGSLPVSLSTSQGMAIMLNWSPRMEVTCPPHSRRKLGLRKAFFSGLLLLAAIMGVSLKFDYTQYSGRAGGGHPEKGLREGLIRKKFSVISRQLKTKEHLSHNRCFY